MPQIELSQGTVEYREQGTGAPIVLIHGLLVNGSVWNRVLPLLSTHARCIAPELPMGGQRIPLRDDADVSPAGIAALVAELLERLDLDQVTLVGNDTGGAICQLVCANHPERVGRLVLTNCDAFENFPPKSIAFAVRGMATIPGAIAALDVLGRLRAVRAGAQKVAPLTVEPVPDELLKGWLSPLHDRRVRRQLKRTLGGIHPEVTLAAAERLRDFERPALIVWGERDRFFPRGDADRLAQMLPSARVERIENARTFVQLDAPDRLAELVRLFVAE